MPIRTILLGLGGATALVHVASFIMIMAELDRRGYKTNMFLARIYFGRYVKAYKEATEKETGKPGPLYGICIGAVMMTLILVVAAVLIPKG